MMARLGLGAATPPGASAPRHGGPEAPPVSARDRRGSERPLPAGNPPSAEPADAWTRALAHPLVPPGCPPPPTAASVAAPPSSLALELVQLEQVVRSLAWGGTRQRGVARLVLATGDLAGARVAVHVDGREVELDLDGHRGPREQAFCERIVERLRARGFVVRVAS